MHVLSFPTISPSAIKNRFTSLCIYTAVKAKYYQQPVTLGSIGILLIAAGADNAHAGGWRITLGGGDGFGDGHGMFFDTIPLREAVCRLFLLIEGPFGGLIMTIAGISAVISAAFGAYRSATSMLVAGVGAFILRSLVSLFFGTEFCTGEYSGYGYGGFLGGGDCDDANVFFNGDNLDFCL